MAISAFIFGTYDGGPLDGLEHQLVQADESLTVRGVDLVVAICADPPDGAVKRHRYQLAPSVRDMRSAKFGQAPMKYLGEVD